MNYKEIEEQRPGRDKTTTINHTYINGGEYRKKYDAISDSPKLNRLLYQLGKQMLEHRSGTKYEDMYWIDLDTLKIVAKEVDSQTVEEITYSEKTKDILKKYKDNPEKRILTIHSHPNSWPPSFADLVSNYQNDYNVGLVVCHNGKIFLYSAMEEITEELYNLRVAKYQNQGYNNYEALVCALKELSEKYDILFKEVMDYDNGK